MKMRKFKFLSLLIASTMLFACNSNTSSTAGGTPTQTPTTAAASSVSADVSTIAQAQAETSTTKEITVQGVVINVTTRSFLISDGTGKIVIWLDATPTNTVGQYLQVKGTLTKRYGNMQFTANATITVLTASKPNVTETVATWTSTEVTTFTGKDENVRGLGVYAKFTGKLNISGYYYNFAIDGVEKAFSASYLPTSLSTGLVSGNNYTVTGWVIDVSSAGYINFYAESFEDAAFVPVTSVEITGDATRTAEVGDLHKLTANVAPTLANHAVTWSSSNTDVATIDASGNFNALAAGSVTITATTVGLDSGDAAKTDTVTYTISAANPNVQSVGFVSADLGLDHEANFESWTSADDIIKIENTNISGTTSRYWEDTTSKTVRIYANNKLTFTVKEGYSVTRVRILTTSSNMLTASAVKDLVNCSVANETVNGVVTPTDGTAVFSLVANSQIRILNLDVDYEVVSE